MARMPESCVDLTVTSPPYADLRDHHGFRFNYKHTINALWRITKPGGVVVWVVGDKTENGSESLESFRQAIYFVVMAGFNLHDTMIYQKATMAFPERSRYWQAFEYMFVFSKGAPSAISLIREKGEYSGKERGTSRRLKDGSFREGKIKSTQYGALPNVWRLINSHGCGTKDTFIHKHHPAAFPEELVRRHIITWCPPGGLVFDPFGGSGTTAKVARSLGNKFITCDISPQYCDLMRKRLSQNMLELS